MMCAVIGAVLSQTITPEQVDTANAILREILLNSQERGRDGFGYLVVSADSPLNTKMEKYIGEDRLFACNLNVFDRDHTSHVFIANYRAEPTTEYVKEKTLDDQQPYLTEKWAIVHNGTIANDKQLRTNEVPTSIDSAAVAEVFEECDTIMQAVECLRGSFAILALNLQYCESLVVAVNYKPVWYWRTEFGVFFASSRSYFPWNAVPQMVEPYTLNSFGVQGIHIQQPLNRKESKRALVVCSGGLDSVVAATKMVRDGYDVELIHFKYGSRAERNEVCSLKYVASALEVLYHILPLPVYQPGDSPLLQEDSKFAGGEAGAEFAHEWVPARNLILLSVATAYAEAHGFSYIVLGNNLEEAGAYPDNEPEFINKFNDMLPFAIGDGKKIEVLMPVGNLMKREIVALGHSLSAPMHLTWSCYRNGNRHCGRCGPCYMRRKAFEINGLPEVISYEAV